MESDIREQQYFRCPCFGTRKEYKDFRKYIHLKDTGLQIYHHKGFQNRKNEAVLMKNTQKAADYVFILKNVKDAEITSADLVSALEKHKISCPRCRNIVEHIKIILQKIPTINKNAVIGVCDHCLKEERLKFSCYKCKAIIKKFATEDKQNKQIKACLSKMQNILQDAKSDGEKSVILKSDVQSDIHLTKSSQMAKTKKRSLEFEPSKIETSPEFIITADSLKSSKLLISTEHFQNKPVPFVTENILKSNEKPFRFREDNFLINQNIDNKKNVIEEMATEKYKEFSKHFESKSMCDLRKTKTELRPLFSQDYITHKDKDIVNPDLSITSFQQIESHTENKINLEFSDSKYHKSDYRKHITKSLPENLSERQISRDTFKDISEFYAEQKPYMKYPESNNIRYKLHLGEDRKAVGKAKEKSQSPLETRNYNSEEALITSKVEVTKGVLPEDFSLYFPEVKRFKKEPQHVQSSAELILDTQNMLIARIKEEKKKNEIKTLQQLQQQERKTVILEEKERLLDIERLYQKKTKEEEEKETKQKSKVKQQKTDEELRDTKQAKVKSLDKTKQRDDYKEPLKVVKEIRNTRKDKEEPLRLQKVENQKQNKEKEMLKKENKIERKKENMEIETLKNNNEKQLQKEIEEKQNQNNNFKKEKKEQLRIHKESQARKNEVQKEKIKSIEQLNKKDDNQSRNKSLKQEKVKDDIEGVVIGHSKGKGNAPTVHLKKDLVELAKEKQEALEMKMHQEETERKSKKSATKKEEEADKFKLGNKKEVKPDIKSEMENSRTQKITDTTTTKELNMNQINLRKSSSDDIILQLVELKQSETKSERHKTTRLSELNITPLCLKEHQEHKHTKVPTCPMCTNSNLELDVESIVMKKDHTGELTDIVIGQKIFKCKPPLIEKKEKELVPILFQTAFNENISSLTETNISDFSKIKTAKISLPPKFGNINEQEPPKGVLRYALSDRTFIDKGWTMLPMEKVVRKMNVYRMRPVHPEFDWFENNKNKRLMLYNTGEKLAEFDDNGLGRWFYRNGRIALDYYNAEEINAQQRIVVYSSGEPDERGRIHPSTVLATFDYLGNGIVFDHGGKIRLKYNQTEGVLLDRSIGPVSHWKWHTLNDPPVLQKVMIDTQMSHKDPEILKMSSHGEDINRPDNEEMLAIEFDNFIKEKSKKMSQTFKPFQIKMKALKINEYFSLKILDQATVYLIFRDGTVNLKLNIGMILDHKEIVDTDTAEVGEVSNNLERFPARTNSLAGLQRSVAYAQRFERLRTDRERRLYPTVPCSSADRLIAPTSRPLHPPFQIMPSRSSSSTQHCKCSRKLSSTNLYYNTRLI